MTLADLMTDLTARGALTTNRVKDIRTSIKHLALAFGYGSPDQCPLDVAWRDEATWAEELQAHFATMEAQGRTLSLLSRRSTRSNIRLVMRTAAAEGLLVAPPGPDPAQVVRLLPTTRRDVFTGHLQATAPYQSTYRSQTGPDRFYGLQQAQWPADIQEGWEKWRATPAVRRLREPTVNSYREHFALYFGYQANVMHRTPTWESLFDTRQLTAFYEWHADKLGASRITNVGFFTVAKAAAMAKVLRLPVALDLAAFRNELPAPTETHIKEDHGVSLKKLEEVADAYLAEGRAKAAPDRYSKFPGARRASLFQKGIILKLLVRVPLRQRNVRELQIGRSIRKDPAGHWHIDFRGDGLKVGKRRGGVNTYHVDLTTYRPDFDPLLEEWIQDWRPRIRNAATSRSLFLTQYGNPFSAHALYAELSEAVALKTGRRWYPHMIRTTWATEALEDTKDFTFVATMLGDTVQMVMKAYQHIDVNQQHAKGRDFLSKALHAG